MGVQKYTQMIDNNGQTINVEIGRVSRFLGEGWSTLEQPTPEKKSPRRGSKNKITAEAHVTSNVVEEATEEEVHVHDENCDHELDQMIAEADALENNEMSTKEN